MKPGPVVVLIPNDRAKIPPNYDCGEPTIEDTLVECDWCSEPCWMTAHQQAFKRRAGAAKVCLACVEVLKQSNARSTSVYLDSTRDIPKRR